MFSMVPDLPLPPVPIAFLSPSALSDDGLGGVQIGALDVAGGAEMRVARTSGFDQDGPCDLVGSSITVQKIADTVRAGAQSARPTDELKLAGRCLLADGRELPCLVSEISAERLVVEVAKAGCMGERIVAYVESLGRIEGEVARQGEGWFGVAIRATDRKRERLAAKIAWLARRQIGCVGDRRHDDRIDACEQPAGLRAPDGREYLARLIDLSAGGAGFYVDVSLPIGAAVILAGLPAVVVRQFAGGMAVRFDRTTTLAHAA